MNQELIFNHLIKHINKDVECTICNKMNWDCDWKEEDGSLSEEEKDKLFNENYKRCECFLSNKLSTNILISGNKIEATEEGNKLLSLFFESLKDYEPR